MQNIQELRDILSEEIDKVRKGESSAAQVNAVTNATGKILSSIKLQMEYAKMKGISPEILFLNAPKKK